MRTLFRMLFTLGFAQAETDGEADNEIHIFTRKMISKGELRDARVGVVGVVTWLQSLSAFAASSAKSKDEATVAIVRDSIKESLLLLKLIKERFADTAAGRNRLPFREDMAKTLGLFCDELARIVSRGVVFPPELSAFVDEHFSASLLQELYLVAYTEPLPGGVSDSEVLMAKSFKIVSATAEDPEEEEDGILVNVLPPLLAPAGSVARRDAAFFAPMCPLFNLAQAFEKRKSSSGSLEDIDALLGCGLWRSDIQSHNV